MQNEILKKILIFQFMSLCYIHTKEFSNHFLFYSIDKDMNSLGMKQGYSLPIPKLPNPVNIIMVHASKVISYLKPSSFFFRIMYLFHGIWISFCINRRLHALGWISSFDINGLQISTQIICFKFDIFSIYLIFIFLFYC